MRSAAERAPWKRAGQRLALVAAGGQRLPRPASRRARDLAQLGLACRAAAARAARAAASAAASAAAARARGVARQLPARLARLALEALVQLGGLGLALERAQARARLPLDVERPVEVVLRAVELELRAAAALAVLAEPGRLLDQQPPVARLGGDDRLHAPLRDDRVHLLAQAGVRQQLEHVRRAGSGRR